MNTKSWHPYQIIGLAILVIAGVFTSTGDYQINSFFSIVGILTVAAGSSWIGSSVALQSDLIGKLKTTENIANLSENQSRSTASSGILLILVGSFYQIIGVYDIDIINWLPSWLNWSPFVIRWLLVIPIVGPLAMVVFGWQWRLIIDEWWVMIVAIGAALLILVVYLGRFYFNGYLTATGTGDWGTFGDYVGGLLNPTFTFIMLVFVWKTFKQEKTQIKTSEESAQRQKVEDQFFKLLELYQKVVKDNQINVIHGQLKQEYNKEITGGYSLLKPSDMVFSEYTASVCYETIFDEEQATLGHYFNIILIILRCLNKFPSEIRNDYADIFRALLSNYEKTLLHYHYEYLGKKGEEFRKLLEEFSLLKDRTQTLK